MVNSGALITGTSALASSGIGGNQVWESIKAQKIVQECRIYRLGDGSTITYPVYPIEPINVEDWADQEACAWMVEEGLHLDQDFLLLFAAAKLAMKEANLSLDSAQRISLVIGHENLGVNRLIDNILTSHARAGEQLLSADPLSSYEAYRNDFFKLQTFPHLFFLAKALKISGMTYTVNNACASGLYALELGRMLIESGQAEAVVVVCADYVHVTEYLWLGEKGFGSYQQKLRPFDARRDGSILGDGAAAVVLEAVSSVSKQAKTVCCRYAGGCFKQDLWKITVPDVAEHSYAAVIADVIQRYHADQIDLLVPHGAGIPLWDLYEAKEIREAFRQSQADIPDITAFKGYIGHTLGANSLLEAVLAMYCMRHNLIPPTLHSDHPDPKIGLPIAAKFIEKPIRSMLKTVPAYGGFHAAALFEKVE
jgi:3-oxoacyl-(acyl-carrier-protein) synthase